MEECEKVMPAISRAPTGEKGGEKVTNVLVIVALVPSKIDR